jgi:hypothetical protein
MPPHTDGAVAPDAQLPPTDEIYPSLPGGESWTMSDPRTDPRAGVGEGPTSTFTPNPDGSWKVQGGSGSGEDIEIRWGITTSTGFNETDIATLNQQSLASQGYMLHANDWRNVEMTGYWRIFTHDTSTSNGEAHIECVARGGRNTGGTTVGGYDNGCEGTSYHSNTYPITGRVKFEKDLDHNMSYGGGANPQRLNAVSPFIDNGQWIGIKTVVYNRPDGKSVQIEQWIDESANHQWRRVLCSVDDGSWPTGGTNCGATPSTVITWGGPLAIFRSDHLLNVDIKDMSVREIQPPAGATACPSAPSSSP